VCGKGVDKETRRLLKTCTKSPHGREVTFQKAQSAWCVQSIVNHYLSFVDISIVIVIVIRIVNLNEALRIKIHLIV
jgi:hypothetical protein